MVEEGRMVARPATAAWVVATLAALAWSLDLLPFFWSLLLLLTATWLSWRTVVAALGICRTIVTLHHQEREGGLLEEEDRDVVAEVMKKVDSRNLRRISRMLVEADVKVLEEQNKKDMAVARVAKSLESRNLRKISKSLQGVDVSRVLSHFSALSQGGATPTARVLRMPYSKAKHVTVHEAGEESGEETDPLSSSESSCGSERSFATSSLVYNNNMINNNVVKDLNANQIVDEQDSLKGNHEFVRFAESTELVEVLQVFAGLRREAGVEGQATLHTTLPGLRGSLGPRIPHRYVELMRLLSERAMLREYGDNTIAQGKRVCVLGGGPCGLRLAMETQLLGAETVVLESRRSIDRNNVIKLWAFVMEDLKSLGAKKLYPGLGCGSVNHVSIRMLQLVLLKMSLLLGVTVRIGESFKEVLRPTKERGWVVVSERMEGNEKIQVEEEYDIVVCATGRRVPLEGFERRSLEAKMSIAITANWSNLNSSEERTVAEIPGLSKQYDIDFFRNLENKCGIQLENIVYYKDLTHYFVMTAKKDSLVRKGVLRRDTDDRESLLHPDNVDHEALKQYAQEAAAFSTSHFSTPLPPTPLATWKGREDVSIFDFTHLYSSQNACRVRQQRGHRLLLGLVGDSLMEPFWPEGTGIGRGFLGVLDTAWMVRRFCLEPGEQVYEVIREREKLYSLLRQTTDSRVKGHFHRWTIDPVTRYPTTSFHFNQERIQGLYSTDTSDTTDSLAPRVRLRPRARRQAREETRHTLFLAD